jgi:hypothetical protein
MSVPVVRYDAKRTLGAGAAMTQIHCCPSRRESSHLMWQEC